jgi:hypothetical protein
MNTPDEDLSVLGLDDPGHHIGLGDAGWADLDVHLFDGEVMGVLLRINL